MALDESAHLSRFSVTRIVPDGPLIKVFTVAHGSYTSFNEIFDTCNAELLPNAVVRSIEDVIPGSTVLVPYFGKYRRAKVLKRYGERTILVQLVDVGGTITCDIDDRIIDVQRAMSAHGVNIAALPTGPPTIENILYGVLKIKKWTLKQSKVLNKLSQVSEEQLKCSMVARISNQQVIRLTFSTDDESSVDLSSFLVNADYAIPATYKQLQMAIYQKYGPPPQTALSSARSPPMYDEPRTTIVSRLPQPEPQSFLPNVLTVGSRHEVHISHMVDGMRNFMVQLKFEVHAVLIPLMLTLNGGTPLLEPFEDTLVPGTVCVGRYDNSLYRAVVLSVLVDAVYLFLVDFGNSVLIKMNEIYKIPSEFLKYKTMAIQFSLNGLAEDLELNSEEAAKIFHDVTMEPSNQIIMEVIDSKVPTKQFCELFLRTNGEYVNIKNRVKDQMNKVHHIQQGTTIREEVVNYVESEVEAGVDVLHYIQYGQILIKKNTVADVIISYVESPAQFFIQLSLNEDELNRISDVIGRDDKGLILADDVHENMAVCARYSVDKKWYRATVLCEPDNNGNVDVLFVDYGNVENIHCSKLRTISDRMCSIPIQAIKCLLDIDPKLSLQEHMVAITTELLAGNEYTMRVLDVLPANILLVDLFEKDTNQNVKDILKERISSALDNNDSQLYIKNFISGLKAEFL